MKQDKDKQMHTVGNAPWTDPRLGIRGCRVFRAAAALAAAGCALAGFPGVAAAAEAISVAHTFQPPGVAVGGDGAARVSVEECTSYHRIGMPEVPFRTARILLPQDAAVEKVEAELLDAVQEIPLAAPLSFGRTPVPIGCKEHPAVARAARDAPDAATYAADTPWPAQRAELVSVQTMHGYRVAIIRVFPIQYRPTSGKLLFCPRIRVNVTVADAAGPQALPPPRQGQEAKTAQVMSFVDNPETAEGHHFRTPLIPAPLTAYDYLLVTASALTNAFQPLVAQKEADGLAVRVETVENVVAGYAGVDDAEKLRAFIRECYVNHGIQYVLLGGDIDTVPYRQAYAYCNEEDPTMPCDLYFACLDGSWNSDGDGYWGEPTDGEDGGDVDLLAEVYVGRAPVDNTGASSR